MAIAPSDFSKIWASNADTPEYTFTEANYLKGWDFVGNLPPTRAQWNAMQKSTDEKMKYVFDNFGAPLTASTVAEMTMRNRVYVYTGSETGYTAGHWYYWNGSAWTDGGVYNSVAFSTDTTLTISGQAADAKATGDAIKSTEAETSLFGVDDLLWDNCHPASKTQNGVTWTVDNANRKVTVVGTPTGTTLVNFYHTSTGDTGFPSWLQKGKEYYFHLGTDTNVLFQIFYYINGVSKIVSVKDSKKFMIPVEADDDRFIIRLAVTDSDLSPVNTVVRPFISEAPSLYEINNRIDTEVMKKLDGVGVSPNTDLDTLKDTGFSYLSSYVNYVNSPLANNQQGIIRIYNTGTMVTQFVNGTLTSDQYVRRYHITTDSWSDWVSDFTDVTKLDKTEASLFGVQDVLWSGANFDQGKTYTKNDVTFTTNTDDRTISVVGTASADNTFYRIFYDGATVMPTLVKGKKYIAHINSDNVYLRIYYNDGNESHKIVNTTSTKEFVIPESAERITIRLDVLEGVTVDETVRPFISEAMSLQELTENVKKGKKSLKILFMGSSTMQDGLTYVPWILQNVAPKLELTMGLGYKSGTNASGTTGYLAGFDDSSYTFDIYSVYTPGASAWVNRYDSVTVKQALDSEDWDVIVPLESILFTGGKIPSDDITHFEALGTLMNKIVSYLGRPVKFGAFFNHNRYATNDGTHVLETADTYTDGIEQYKTYVWEAYANQFIFPNFTAYWNARGTTLDQYGNAEWHHMLADYAHYQEGIGCYLGSCSSALTILDIAGITDKSILGEQTRPDMDWVTSHSIPGQNYGTGEHIVAGISDENCLIAQKCAIMAHKFPWKISTIN